MKKALRLIVVLSAFAPNQLFSQPCTATITGNNCTGDVLIAETGSEAISQLVWKNNGIPVFFSDTIGTPETVTIVAGGRGNGVGYNQFGFPSGGIFVDKALNIYVADTRNNRVMKWAPGATIGTLVAGGRGSGASPEQLNHPKDVFLNSVGNLYVADYGNHRVQKFAPGSFSGITIAGGKGAGVAGNQLYGPNGIYVDNRGYLYIADTHNYRVQRWAPGATRGATVAGGAWGIGPSQFQLPVDVYLDAKKNIYVADAASDESIHHRIVKWNKGATSGNVVAGGNGLGSAANQFNYITSLYVDSIGNIYVNDVGNRRLQKWAPGASSGITVAGGYGIGYQPHQLYYGTGVSIGSDSNIYVFDGANYSVKRFVPTHGHVERKFTPAQTGVYTLEAVFKNSCSATSSPVKVYTIPGSVIRSTTTGSMANLCGGGIDTFYVDRFDDATTYTWNIPKGSNLIEDKGDSIIIEIPTSYTGGLLVNIPVNGCGAGKADTAWLRTRPGKSGDIQGRSYAMISEANLTYKVPDKGFTYNWTVPTDATIVGGQGTSSIVVNWGAKEGLVAVSASNSCGTSGLKERKVYIKNSRSLALSKENEVAKNRSDLADHLTLQPEKLAVFPNPAKGVVRISFHSNKTARYTLTVFDNIGKPVVSNRYRFVPGKNVWSLNVAGLVPGVYLLSLSNEHTREAQAKLVVK